MFSSDLSRYKFNGKERDSEKTRLVAVPLWVKQEIDGWLGVAGIEKGPIFRRVLANGRVGKDALTELVVWQLVREYAAQIGIGELAPHDLRRYAESEIMPNRDSKMPSNPRESCRSSVVRPGPCGIIRCASQDTDEAQHSPSND